METFKVVRFKLDRDFRETQDKVEMVDVTGLSWSPRSSVPSRDLCRVPSHTGPFFSPPFRVIFVPTYVRTHGHMYTFTYMFVNLRTRYTHTHTHLLTQTRIQPS